MAGKKKESFHADLEAHLRFERLLSDLAAQFVNLPVDEIDPAIENALFRVCRSLDIDVATLWQRDEGDPGVFVLTHYCRTGEGPRFQPRMNANLYFPWSVRQAEARRVVALSSTGSAPPEAIRDAESWRSLQVRSVLTIPLSNGEGPILGGLGFNDGKGGRDWPEPLVQRLQLVASVFASTLLRRKTEQALRESEERLLMATEAAEAGPWLLELECRRLWCGRQLVELFGLPPVAVLDFDLFIGLVHADDRAAVLEAIRSARETRAMTTVEYRIVRPDGAVRWMQSRGRLPRDGGAPGGRITGITSDITARKETEHRLQEAHDEVRRLRDRLQHENLYLREQAQSESGQGAIVGESLPIRRMLALARKVAATDSAVLITGETGTGKELLAQAVHELSARKGKTLVKVNCAALPAPLIESELFGREKGAYTGAMTQQVGRFEIADGSTIFLDEIGDLPLDLQVKLLHILQDGQYERLGSHRTLKTDVRVIAASNRDLAAMVKQGRFREDLFHRLNVFPIEVPPLRERTEDIPLLVWKFVRMFNERMGRSVASIPKPVMERLRSYAWPGNVRELRNVIERAMIISEGDTLSVDVSGLEQRPAGGASATLLEVERDHIRAVLQRTNWRIRGLHGAAAILGIPPTTLHSRLKKLGLVRPGVGG